MFEKKLSRREMLKSSGLALLGSSFLGVSSCVQASTDKAKNVTSAKDLPFRISLNTSTIQGYKLGVEEQIDRCIETGFDGIELWVRDVEDYIKRGGSPEALAERMKKGNLLLENMIGFSNWISDDDLLRAEALNIVWRDMELTARLGGKFIAAPVQGIRSIEKEKLPVYAERYRKILEIGDQVGVTPILELWGAGALNKLSDTAAITIGAAHPKATMLLDFYHLFRGGNSFESLRQINGSILPVFHINDYPAQPPRNELRDSDRVFPGEGICPFREVLPILYESGFRGGLSVELFNRSYWETMDVKTVLQNSYDKTARVISESGV
ncbi:2-keto-myo-inositol isomerase [Parabacteroides sp. PF5-5]|uniref:sugar phosphate isomerase/epimerase family protein n=1 Tax=unclassified Parabacteroides TaxID=2649774 RepID=UPI0024759DD4|nr:MULTISPECIES: sugar phosphate isomerase/epimerase family protein [unclassified Parabacteroides]MDH6306990.1 2-keto-myo-inositol isomerase [Parabacteroides sp. PH5-39]MDH6317878.1 2-keto-myo-inositol isomerase [Parabacteroides sp. PF5-13]MDH6321640.1 2-keto-myo-inositol isomerase [Parabacteroides sp. PH5-13]MDH6325377.1 2-keto-myo-inositol isomerase [Parabacteroides sp. PH5-8]MDH6329093.1 2-keto-myo-inositol isomerase [Parabacteroides sp. PH5-41]